MRWEVHTEGGSDMRGIELFEMVLSLLFIIGASVASSLITFGLMCCVGGVIWLTGEPVRRAIKNHRRHRRNTE